MNPLDGGKTLTCDELHVTRLVTPGHGDKGFQVLKEPTEVSAPPFQQAWQKPLMVAADNIENLDNSLPVKLYSSQSVGDYYRKHPIPAHSVPTASKSILTFTGDNQREVIMTAETPLPKCSLITLNELRCPRRYKGKYLLVKVLSKTKARVGIHFFVGDENDLALPLHILYPSHCPAMSLSQQTTDSWYPVNTIIAIRDPYIHYGLNDEAEIMVASPADIVEQRLTLDLKSRFSMTGSAVTDPKIMRAVADRAMQRGNLVSSLKYYDLILNSLEMCDSALAIEVRLARAQVLLQMRKYGSAYRDCAEVENSVKGQKSDDIEALRKRAYFIQLEAAYHLKLYDTAQRHLSSCIELQVDAWKIDRYQNDIMLRQKERKGEFDWPRIRDCIKSGQNVELANYYGPIKIHRKAGRGRTLVATENIKAGQVLIVEKAFLAANVQDYPHLKIHTGSRAGEIFDITEMTIGACQASQAIQDNPAILTYLNHLMPCSEKGYLDTSEDTRLMSLLDPPFGIDAASIGRKFLMNGFHDSNSDYSLFQMISMINHSCSPNATKHPQSGHFIIQAKRDISVNEEVTISYVNPIPGFETRQAGFKQTWEFQCNCNTCLADSKDDYVVRERMMEMEWPTLIKKAETFASTLLTLIRSKVSDSKIDAETAKQVVLFEDFARRLEKTYDKERQIRIALAEVYAAMAGVSVVLPPAAEKYSRESLRLRGFVLSTPAEAKVTGEAIKIIGHLPNDEEKEVLRSMIAIADSLRRCRPNKDDQPLFWYQSAWRIYRIFKGPMSTKEGFQELCGKVDLTGIKWKRWY